MDQTKHLLVKCSLICSVLNPWHRIWFILLLWYLESVGCESYFLICLAQKSRNCVKTMAVSYFLMFLEPVTVW